MIAYADGQAVALGDRVSIRTWFKNRSGIVVYLPGTSLFNPQMEHNGLTWVGIRLDGGGFVGTVVLYETGRLKKTVKLIARGPRGSVEGLAPDVDPFQEVE